MQNATPVPRPRPTKPDYTNVFLEPVYDEFDPADDDFDSDHSHADA
ncbi:hypothetical protein [Streptomyces decoyicus]